jgi:M-phase-specific PLK1-interacting protein
MTDPYYSARSLGLGRVSRSKDRQLQRERGGGYQGRAQSNDQGQSLEDVVQAGFGRQFDEREEQASFSHPTFQSDGNLRDFRQVRGGGARGRGRGRSRGSRGGVDRDQHHHVGGGAATHARQSGPRQYFKPSFLEDPWAKYRYSQPLKSPEDKQGAAEPQAVVEPDEASSLDE